MCKVQMRKLMTVSLLMISAVFVNGADFKPDRTLYVSVKGSDSNDGLTEKTAFKTIGKASETVNPGDLVLVKGGIYREKLMLSKSGTKEKPIVFRAVPNETVVVTWGWDMNGWKKIDGTRFCYEMSFPYAVNMLWERKTLSRYLELDSMDILDKQPGGFFSDKNSGKIYIHAFDGGIPEASGIVAVPYRAGKKPVSYTGQTSKMPDKFRNAAFAVVGDYNTVEGFELAFHPMGGFILGEDRLVTGSALVKNIVYGCACGLAIGPGVSNSAIENNFVYKCTSSGILLCGFFKDIMIKDIIVRNNYLFNNGPCPPFEDQFNVSFGQGQPYNMAQYSHLAENFSFINNMIISDDYSRHYGTMRCKGGIDGNMELSGNVFIGGGPFLYPKPQSKTLVRNNTVIGISDKFNERGHIGYKPETGAGEKFQPVLKDNLCLKDNKVKAGFADTSFYDYRLRKDSKFTGSGAYPEAGHILYVSASAKEGADGSAPEKALKTLSAAFQKAVPGNCIYILPGTYKENLSLMKKENIALRNYGKGKVVLESSSLDMKECKNLNIDGMIFRNSKVQLQNSDGVEFLHCVFDGNGVKAENCGLTKIINDTFIGNAFLDLGSATLVLRNNLFVNSKVLPVKSEAAKTISENNVLSGENAEKVLADWKNKYSEGIPSFSDNVKLQESYALPDGSRLLYSGLGWTFIGARATEKKNRPVIVGEFKVLKALDDRVILQWETPFDYPDAKVVCKDKNGTIVYSAEIPQEEYKETVRTECIKGLKPNSQYDVSLTLTNPGGVDKIEKTMTVTTKGKEVFHPKTIYVSKSGDDSKSGLSSAEARKTISAALNASLPGDTVIVAPGTYTEQVKIDMDGLSEDKPFILKSEKAGKAIINANSLFSPALSINHGKYITLDGFKFEGLRYSSRTEAIKVTASEYINIKNCMIGKWGGLSNISLMCTDVKNISVSNCIFACGFHGIWMKKCNNVKIFNNVFKGNAVSGIHVGCRKDYNVEIYNNILDNVVYNHNSAAVTTGEHGDKIICDYNIYWKTADRAPKQKIYGTGGKENSAPWDVKKKDSADTLEDARKMYGVEMHGQAADPLFRDTKNGDFSVKPGSPAIGKGRNGADIGVDMSVFLK